MILLYLMNQFIFLFKGFKNSYVSCCYIIKFKSKLIPVQHIFNYD